MNDIIALVKKCEKFKKYVNLHHTPIERLQFVAMPWLFYK